jgi:cell division protein FtsN
MAARRGKSQARRSGGNASGLPGWAWLIIGVLLALVAVMLAPKFLKSEGEDGFFRPRANPDAQPTISALDEDDATPAAATPARPSTPATTDAPLAEPEYDFYTVLPEQEVAMTDAELAASARAEADRQRRNEQAQQARNPDAADPAVTSPTAPAPSTATATTTRPATTSPAAQPTPAAATRPPVQAAAGDNTRYILQAGSFSASGDAEALKARIALLGLAARVESGDANGKTVYRVRMGPYGTATDLAEAKQKLGNGGLPALAIKAQ